MSTRIILTQARQAGRGYEPAGKEVTVPEHLAEILISQGLARRPGDPDPKNKSAEPPTRKAVKERTKAERKAAEPDESTPEPIPTGDVSPTVAIRMKGRSKG
jgi:hypothetical protein